MVSLSPEQHQRFVKLSRNIPCPTCLGQTVYESDTPESLLIRHDIQKSIISGHSDFIILQRLGGQHVVHDAYTDQNIGAMVLISAFVFLISVFVYRYFYSK